MKIRQRSCADRPEGSPGLPSTGAVTSRSTRRTYSFEGEVHRVSPENLPSAVAVPALAVNDPSAATAPFIVLVL